MENTHGSTDTMDRLKALYAKRDEDYKRMEHIFNQREAQIKEKEQRLLFITKQLDDREKQIISREEKCKEKEKTLADRSSFLNDRASDLDKKLFEHEAAVYKEQDRIAMLVEEARNEKMAARVKKEEYNYQLSMLGENGSGLLEQIASLEDKIKEKEAELQEKDDIIEQKEIALLDIKNQIQQKNQEVEEKEQKFLEMKNQIQQKDQEAEEKEQKLFEQDKLILEKETLLQSKDARINDLAARIEELTERDDKHARTIKEYNTEKQSLEEQINLLTKEVDSGKTTLESKQVDIEKYQEKILTLENEIAYLKDSNTELQSQKADLFRQLVDMKNPDSQLSYENPYSPRSMSEGTERKENRNDSSISNHAYRPPDKEAPAADHGYRQSENGESIFRDNRLTSDNSWKKEEVIQQEDLDAASVEAYLNTIGRPAEILHNKYGELVRTSYKDSTVMFCFEDDLNYDDVTPKS